MKKVLFLDRDGTLIIEPNDEQIDSLEKLEFYPKVFRVLNLIKSNFDYELVIVSNQDGLGTDSFPTKDFQVPQDKMIKAFENEGVTFDDIIIDKTLPKDNAPTRKPKTGLLNKYINGEYDLKASYVIGDRVSDIELAKNLGSKAILIGTDSQKKDLEKNGLNEICKLISPDWDEIYSYLATEERVSVVKRETKETKINIKVDLDGSGKTKITTGIGFFDHMLDQIGKHSGIDLNIDVKGDLEVDEHHTVEDTAIALGEAIYQALGSKRGIERYGYTIPMDDSLAQVALDFGGRSWLVWEAEFKREKVGEMPTELFFHFFKSFSDAAKCNLNIKVEGDNEHHKIEGIFKAFAKAIKMAIKKDVFNNSLPTTKGML